VSEQKVRIFGRFISIIVVLSVLLTSGTFSARGTASELEPTPSPTISPTPGSTDPRGQQPAHIPRALSLSGAPGYCPSTGGSTLYESITSVTLIPNPDGTMKLVVQVYIANPTGCTAGEPCPEYDDSPEYVNVWIDWDGDKTWKASERVMDKALTGYLAINYHGTMTAVSQFSPPSSVTNEPTWLRANLGWAYDPNDPCEYSWTWGNVVDKQIHLKTPEIKSITAQGCKWFLPVWPFLCVVGTPGNKPQTGSKVRLEADIEVPTGYEVTKCSWTGSLTPGDGDPAKNCRYDYTPATGPGPAVNTYGEKKVTLTITYKHTVGGTTGQASKQHEYNVYFGKTGDDNSDGAPNWFEYWKLALGRDGRVSYGGKGSGSNGGTAGCDPPPFAILYEHAGYGPHPRNGSVGIDRFAGVLAHELQHVSDFQFHLDKNGSCFANTDDADSDRLDNDIDHFPNTVNGAGYPEYTGVDAWRGDWEYNARQVENVIVSEELDWANPGKQAGGNQGASGSQSAGTVHSTIGVSGFGLGEDDSNLAQAEFTDNYFDYGTDLDGDSQYDYLTLDVQLSVTVAGNVIVIGGLESGESTIWAEATSFLDTGTHWMTLSFVGQNIYQQREDGPYSISLRIDLEDWLDTELVADTYITSAYSYNDFEHPSVVLTGNYTDMGVDTDGDSLYDFLRINVGLDVQEPITCTVIGELEGSDSIAVASTIASLSTGGQTVDLDLDGHLIFQHRTDGPYHLRKLRAEDTSGNRIDFVYDAYTTAAYTYGQFQHSGTTIDATSYSDQGLDVDSDGDYDYLRVDFQIDVNQVGIYRLLATLNDSGGESIASIEQDLNMLAGSNAVSLDFPGGAIYDHGVDGPYQVASVALLDADGTIVDYQQVAHTTQAYSYADFSPPLISLTGNYQDYGQDIDDDGLYDYLNIDISVIPGDAGVIVAQGRLVDSTEQEIEWIENYIEMDAGTAQIITLAFTGELIFANRRNGPFELRDLLVYHTGDPGQGVFVSQAHTTAAYSYLDFEGISKVYLPLILKNYPPDTTPPAAVTNLSTSNPTLNSITLNWTAPGDDCNIGTAWKYDIRYSTSPITDANWNAAAQCAGEPAPKPAGSSETFTVHGLAPNTTHYFALKTADEVPNWSCLSNVASGTTLCPDTTPPAAVTNLATSNPTLDSITLNWTAPGDDGDTGTASKYDIRYSTSPITDANWNVAAQCAGEPAPKPAGSSETFTINGLNPNTTHYFALKTADEVPNWSGLSNVASGTTLRPSDQLIINCGFETDEGWVFGDTPRPAAYTTEDAHWGARSVRLGIKPPTTDAYSWSSIRQRITIPANAKSATLSFWYKPFSEAPCGGNWQQFDWSDFSVDQPGRIASNRNPLSWASCDWQQALILADNFPNPAILATVMNISSNSGVWTHETFDLTPFAGRTIWIYFNVYNDGWGYGRTWMYVDDASVMVYY
jgi:hypothetical protein